jgi:CDP-diacylglycerol---serine O-phosphatidyltransferase
MIFITKFPVPALVTYASICCAMVGIGLSLTYVDWALVLLLVCAILDIGDGYFARSFERNVFEKKFGIAIDSLADTLAFIALPGAIFIIATGSVIVPIVYALCGITRLAVFTAEASPNTTTKYYRGLPVTAAGFLIPVVYLLGGVIGIDPSISMSMVYIVLAGLFVLNIKIKKP